MLSYGRADSEVHLNLSDLGPKLSAGKLSLELVPFG